MLLRAAAQLLLLGCWLAEAGKPPDFGNVGRRKQPPERQLWSHKTKGGIASSPVLSPDGSVLYVGSNGKEFVAVRTSDGVQLWSVPADRWCYCSPTLTRSGDVVYYGSDDFHMRAVNTSTGEVIWSFQTGGEMTSRPALSPDETVVYAGSHDKKLRAWRASDGTVIWAFEAEDQVTSSPVVSHDGRHIYVGSYDKHLYAINAADGTVAWKFLTGGEIWSSPVLNAKSDRVFIGSNDKSCYAVDTANGKMVWNFTTRGMLEAPPRLSRDDGVVYFGSDDYHLYAVNATTGSQLWSFLAGDSVACGPAVSKDGGSVYVGANSGVFFSINATTGEGEWQFETEGPIFGSPVVAPDDSKVYVGSWDGRIYGLRSGALQSEWDLDPATIGLVISGIVLSLWLVLWYYLKWKYFGADPRELARTDSKAKLLGHTVTRTLPFWIAGAMLGLGIGAATMWVQVLIRSKMPYGEGTNYPKDFFGSVPFYSLAVFLSMLLMAFVWGLWALIAVIRHEKRVLDRLPDFCGYVILYSSLTVGFNLLPGIWVTSFERSPGVAGRVGSRPDVLLIWFVFSYPLGILCLALELWLLEGIFFTLEQATTNPSMSFLQFRSPDTRRFWRGHWARRWVMVFPAYNWGFMVYWVWTGATLHLYNHHQGYVPPFTPLSVLGWAAGTVSLTLHLLRRPDPFKDRQAWVRKRVRDIDAFLTWWPTKENRSLRQRWKRTTKDIRRHIGLRALFRLFLNACCPSDYGMREKVSSWTGIHLSSLPGCQSTLNDELDWAYAVFAVKCLAAVVPLIAYWLYQRFGDGRVLNIQPPYVTLTDSKPFVSLPNSFGQDPAFNYTPPLPLLPTSKPNYLPLEYGQTVRAPFQACHWSDIGAAYDPGDFNLCLERQWQKCMEEDNCVFPRCIGMATSILAEPSRSLWFQMQLLCYAGFLLLVIWTIKLEREEKMYVSMAFRLNGIFRDSHGNYRAASHATVRIFMLALGGLFAASLMLDQVQEDFVFYASYYIKQNSFYISQRDSITGGGPLLTWFCEAMGNQVYTARIRYALSISDTPIVAIVQGVYFFYQLYSMLRSQEAVYEFVEPDILLTSHLETQDPASQCSYWSILQHRESGKVIERSDVDEVLHKTVYLPFIRHVYQTRSDIIYRLFNQYEVTMLLSTMEDSVEMEPVLPSSGRYKEEEEETKGQRHGDLWEDR